VTNSISAVCDNEDSNSSCVLTFLKNMKSTLPIPCYNPEDDDDNRASVFMCETNSHKRQNIT
jgi:hypothetical protein